MPHAMERISEEEEIGAGLETPLVAGAPSLSSESKWTVRVGLGSLVSLLVLGAMMAGIVIESQGGEGSSSRDTMLNGTKPNFVVFLVDDLGYGDLGCFGRVNVSTPNVDGIARNGVKFTQWVSAASICTPSRAAFQTGRLPVRLGMVSNSLPFRVFPVTASTGGIPQDELTIAQALKTAGYRTGISGKWHLGISSVTEKFVFLPNRKGYDSFLGIPFTNMHKCKEIPKGGDGKLFCMLMANETIIQQPLVEQNLTRALTKHATTFIEESVAQGVPFYFLFSFLHVHTPLFTSPEFKHRSKGGEFGDNVEEMDHAVGVVLAKLRQLKIEDNTLVILTSDNGPYAEEGYDQAGRTGGLKGSKGQTFDGGIRMPAVAQWPGVIPAGKVTDQLVGTMDIFPTFTKLAGVNRQSDTNSKPLDGSDIIGLMRHPESARSPHEYMFHYCGANLAAVRQVREDGKRVLKYHFLTAKWKTHGNSSICTECCPYGKFAFQGSGGSLCDCQIGSDLEDHGSIPVIYDVTNDMFERHELTAESFPGGVEAYNEALESVKDAVQQHKTTLLKVKDQMKGLSPFNFPCCKGLFFQKDGCICDLTRD